MALIKGKITGWMSFQSGWLPTLSTNHGLRIADEEDDVD